MKCTIFQLFPLLSEMPCEGSLSKLSDLEEISAVDLLERVNCNVKVTGLSMAQLILNKVTPEKVDISKVGGIDICNNHLSRLTYKHKSLRQKHCAIENCERLGETERPRVNLITSDAVLNVSGHHVLVGSILCSHHRRNFTYKLKESALVPTSRVVSTSGQLPTSGQVSTSGVVSTSSSASNLTKVPRVSSSRASSRTPSTTAVLSISSSTASPRTRDKGPIVSTHTAAPILPSGVSTLIPEPVPVCSSDTPEQTHDSTRGPVLVTNVGNVEELKKKRKSFNDALNRLPEFTRKDSDTSPISNSQGSSFSETSEAEAESRVDHFQLLVSCIGLINPSLAGALTETVNLCVQQRTLQR